MAADPLYQYPFPFERNPVKEKTDSYSTWPFSTVGKLYYNDPQTNTDHVCTAAVLVATNLDLIMTAGHCIHSGGVNDHVFADFYFVPQYDNGTTQAGQWSWRGSTVPGRWTQAADPSYDYGALVLDTDITNRHVQNVTGGLGYQYNGPRKTHWHVEGYPSKPPFTGGDMEECTASYAADGKGSTLGIGCDAPSAGSPWITNFVNDGTNGDYFNGLTSYQYSSPSEPAAVYGPYLDGDWFTLYSHSANK